MRFQRSVLIATFALIYSSIGIAQDWQPLPTTAPAPADNPTTPARVELGKMLYFDPRFSSTGTVSCFSCHNVMEGGDDHRSVSMGVHGLEGGRNAPTVYNAAFHSVQFWDGRAPSLEAQAKGPVVNPVEMGMTDQAAAIQRIGAITGYKPYFDAAFGPGANVTIDNAAKAIAAYERTLITPNSPYDRFASGDRAAISAAAQRGLTAFAGVGCTTCHQGPAFNGPNLPEGTGFYMRFPTFPDTQYVKQYALDADEGRFVATGAPADKHMWRVPTLRNLVYTAPYFHNGAVKSLDEAVRVMAATQLNRTLTGAETADIVAFLETLTGTFPEQTMPRLPPTPGNLLP
jgi:cytochrome c peroxidase